MTATRGALTSGRFDRCRNRYDGFGIVLTAEGAGIDCSWEKAYFDRLHIELTIPFFRTLYSSVAVFSFIHTVMQVN